MWIWSVCILSENAKTCHGPCPCLPPSCSAHRSSTQCLPAVIRQAEPKDPISSLGPSWSARNNAVGQGKTSYLPEHQAWPIRMESGSLLAPCQSPARSPRCSLCVPQSLPKGVLQGTSESSVLWGDLALKPTSSRPKYSTDLPLVSAVSLGLNAWKAFFPFMMNEHKFVSSCIRNHMMPAVKDTV